MVTPYTQNENCYILTNFSDSNNPMFLVEEDKENFQERADRELSPLCEIMGYVYHNDQFIILVVLKDRATFVEYYRDKVGDPEFQEAQILESTYILSQVMANIQSGYAKWFNSKYDRFGSLFGRRYTKILIETEEALKDWVQKIKNHVKCWDFKEFWSYVRNFVNRYKKLVKISKGVCWKTRAELEQTVMKYRVGSALSLEEFNLRGRYIPKPLPPILAAKSRR